MTLGNNSFYDKDHVRFFSLLTVSVKQTVKVYSNRLNPIRASTVHCQTELEHLPINPNCYANEYNKKINYICI